MTRGSITAGYPITFQGLLHRTRVGIVLLITFAAGLACALLPLQLAFVLIVGALLLLLTLIQPLIGVSLILLTGPLAAVESLRIGGILISTSQILFLLTVSIWLAYNIVRRRIIIPSTPINWFLVLFVVIGAVSLINAPSLRLGLKEEIKWVEMAIAVFMVTDLAIHWQALEDRSRFNLSRKLPGIDIRFVLGMVLLAGMSQALIGIWQFGLRGDGPDHFLILDRFYRASGTFQQPNPFGGFMGMTAAMAIGALIGTTVDLGNQLRSGIRPRTSDWLWFLFLTSTSLTSALALMMSWSRGAWLGFASGFVVLVFFLPKKRWKGAFLLLLGLVLVVGVLQLNLVPGAITERVLTIGEDLQISDVRGEHVTIENFAVIERLAHWQAGLAMARDNLFLGVGFGNYEVAYEDYRLLNWEHPLGHAHNYYINVVAETGIIGGIIYLLMWGFIFYQGIRLLGRLDWPDRGIGLGLIVAFTALTVHHFFDKLYVNNLYLFLGVMLATQQILALKHDQTRRTNR